jgi:precorrin-6B methylase 2
VRNPIDDVRLSEENDKGDPIRFSNQEFRKLFNLAHMGKDDTFYDLGSGWGQSLILAVTEFGAGKAVGIEKDAERVKVSLERIRRRGIEDRATVVLGDFGDLYTGELSGCHLSEPTVIMYALTDDDSLIGSMKKQARRGCRLIYYFNGLFTEIKPQKVDFPFYVSTVPFESPKSEVDWLSSVVRKKASSLKKGEAPTSQELWEELTHDYDVYSGDPHAVSYYKRSLRRMLKVRED